MTDQSRNGQHGPRRELTLVVVQARPVPNDEAATQEAFFAEVRRLRRMFPATDLFLYPELHLTGLAAFGTPLGEGSPSWEARSESIPGPLTDRLCALARELLVEAVDLVLQLGHQALGRCQLRAQLFDLRADVRAAAGEHLGRAVEHLLQLT